MTPGSGLNSTPQHIDVFVEKTADTNWKIEPFRVYGSSET